MKSHTPLGSTKEEDGPIKPVKLQDCTLPVMNERVKGLKYVFRVYSV